MKSLMTARALVDTELCQTKYCSKTLLLLGRLTRCLRGLLAAFCCQEICFLFSATSDASMTAAQEREMAALLCTCRREEWESSFCVAEQPGRSEGAPGNEEKLKTKAPYS